MMKVQCSKNHVDFLPQEAGAFGNNIGKDPQKPCPKLFIMPCKVVHNAIKPPTLITLIGMSLCRKYKIFLVSLSSRCENVLLRRKTKSNSVEEEATEMAAKYMQNKKMCF